jgi:subtilisin family serine protease/plastocyanin
MSEKEYIVSLHRNVDHEAFNQEMIAHTSEGAIPCRCVDVANTRPGSKRNTHYMLTDLEAETLRNDPRVLAVEIPAKNNPTIGIGLRAIQTGDFSKTTEDRGFFINWGLRRVNEATNPYEGNTVSGGYNYTLDGTGVDIVIQDTGIQADHPEWQDTAGNSRLQQIDWYTASGLSGVMPTGHYTDFHGHGTHVGATAAGKTYGWAKNARIYAIKVEGLEGPADPNSGIPVEDCFDVIKLWHRNKPIDPVTGVKRPTIVNMSWGYFQRWSTVSEIVYRGVSYTGASIDTEGEITNFGFLPLSDDTSFIAPARISTVDVDIEELIDEGVHVVIAAGNNFHKIDIVGGLDYNNNATTNAQNPIFYHRGSSPYSIEAHMTGNIDSVIHSDDIEQKAESSCAGPGVTVYAPGTNIMAAVSNTNIFVDDGPYPQNADFKITNISGTSMAAPQVSGVLALYAQINPSATPAQAKAYIENTAQTDQLFETGNDNDYGNFRSLYNGPNRYLFNKFNSAVQLTLGNPRLEDVTPVTPVTPTYSVTPAGNNVDEGSSLTINVATTNVTDGTTLYWTVTNAGDFATSSGSFVINSDAGSFSVTPTADATTEGPETFTVSIRTGSTSGTVVATSSTITINDTSTTPVTPTYTITPAASSVNEGSSLTFNVGGTNITNGTYYWTVSRPEDFAVSSGSFTITSNVGSFNVTPTADATTEGPETFTASVRTGSTGGTIVATSSTITINDTSTTPVTPTADYTINVTNSGASAYTLSGNDRNGTVSGNNPSLAFNNGDVVDFVVNASGHPFYIKTAAVTGTGSQANGVTNNGAEIGTVQWTVGSSGTFYYICQFHSSMVGTITAS